MIVSSATVLLIGGGAAAGAPSRQVADVDWSAVQDALGRPGTMMAGDVFRIGMPRTDLKVTVNGVPVQAGFALGSYAAFKQLADGAMVMGDLVLTEEQISPVMSAALDNGLEVTALHNHFVWDSPKIMFMHVGGMGPEQNLATSVGRVFTKIKETSGGKGERPDAQIDPAHSSLDPAKLDSALGLKGQYKDGVYKFVVGRTTRMHDVTIGNQMGVNTWGTFAGSDNKAVVDGDFAMHEDELQNVLKTLRKAGINVVAIHQHMVGEEPRIMFLHYWGVAPAGDLAKGLRAALDATRD